MAEIQNIKNLYPLEWLQSNPGGSFALGCVDRIPRRKYHSLLTVREPGMGEPLNILTDVVESISINGKKFLLYAINYNGQVFPQGFQHLVEFYHSPHPHWVYQFDGIRVDRILKLDPNKDGVRVFYKISGIKEPLQLTLEPIIPFRPMHRLTQENPFLNGAVTESQGAVSLQPYAPLPKLYMKISNQASTFHPSGRWDKNVFYSIERERGYDAYEDLYCPGRFQLELKADGFFTFSCGISELKDVKSPPFKPTRTSSFEDLLKGAADQFLMKTKEGFHTAVAGFPWFEGWSRDTLIALPGLCLSTGKINEARQILENFGSLMMQGVMPNTPASNEQNQNTRVDAPLLYIRAVQLLEKGAGQKAIKPLMPVVYHLLNSFKKSPSGDRVRVTEDGGLFIETGSHPMTWMDAVIEGEIVTPRFGFAVDINALFYNAIHFALEWARVSHHSDFIREWQPIVDAAESSFLKRFWSEKHGYLADTHDGKNPDFSLRPNQLFATAVPYSPVPLAIAKKVVEKVRNYLLTPVGLRTLSPSDPHYKKQYKGGQRERDYAYHQGTVWPWLIGIYADSVLKVSGHQKMRSELLPILKRMETHLHNEGCLGQISEVFDADDPYSAGGTPAQAWSVSEVLRVWEMVTGK